MGRVVIKQYGVSNSAKALANHIGCKRLKVYGSQFVGKIQDVVINWGSQQEVPGRARVLNKPSAVYNASNKLKALQLMESSGVSIPRYQTDLRPEDRRLTYVARTKLSGHSGEGIIIVKPDDILPDALLYTEYIPKVREYRAIVVGSEVVDFKQKKKRSSPRDSNDTVIEDERITHDEHVWNLDGGYIFARDGITKPSGVDSLSVNACSALSLDFGAVDIIEDREGNLYVLEVNTAFGLEGTTIDRVGDAISRLIQGE
ncbi:hypothetical protein KAU11_07340 [Candidatus Babeliales bacterium]|nr:hypothetical protein [Candidatus Babeliales bacterium]